MKWSDLLAAEIDNNYRVTDQLISLVEDSQLGWKPEAGSNWMTTGQLLQHITNACGMPMRGFVTGDWGFPEGMSMDDIPPEEMLPPAEKLPTVSSVAEARKLLAADKQVALETLAGCTEDQLTNDPAPAPWDTSDIRLGHRLLQMVNHLNQHKGQLFYYLKLQGKDLNTNDLWGK